MLLEIRLHRRRRRVWLIVEMLGGVRRLIVVEAAMIITGMVGRKI